MTLRSAILSCGLDGRPDILQAMFSGSKTSLTKRWTKVLNSPNFQWMPNVVGACVPYASSNDLLALETGVVRNYCDWLCGRSTQYCLLTKESNLGAICIFVVIILMAVRRTLLGKRTLLNQAENCFAKARLTSIIRVVCSFIQPFIMPKTTRYYCSSLQSNAQRLSNT